jgi:hypothetical protein
VIDIKVKGGLTQDPARSHHRVTTETRANAMIEITIGMITTGVKDTKNTVSLDSIMSGFVLRI